MFRLKRKQKTILDHDIYLPEERRQALEKSWAGPFRKTVLPMIQEEPFRPCYCPDNGRPNVPVAVLTGLCILKELHNLTDQEVLGSLEFDLRWQYAFDLNALEAHICQKTLHNFRVLVTTNQQARQIFQGITADLITAAGLSTAKQRLDSTQIVSNMSHLTRLGLFIRVIEGFLKRLKKQYPRLYQKLPQVYDQVYLQRAGYFADVKSSQGRRRLAQSARHLFDLVDRFRGHAEISHLQAYRLMERLLQEQCHIQKDAPEPVTLKDPKEIPADSLQSPADPEATYGRKGKGYKASLTETCAPENPFQVITDVAVEAASASDQQEVVAVLDRLDETAHKPTELFADAGYGSGANILEAQARGVELVAPITSGSPPDLDRMQLSDFEVSADGRQVLACITGQTPLTSRVTEDGRVVALFAQASCSRCPFLPVCRVKRHHGAYRLKYKLADLATSRRRQQQETAHFKERYKIRSGIEATISEAHRLTGLKRVWTRGRQRVRLSVFFKALAINIKRFIQNALAKAQKALAPTPGTPAADDVGLCRCPLGGQKGVWGSLAYPLAA